MIDLNLIGKDRKYENKLCCYLKWDRYSALADYILSRNSLEVPIDYYLPDVKELPAIKQSCCDWPDRLVLS